MSRRIRSAEERFWEKVEKTDACWNWTGCTTQKGYGTFTISKGFTRGAHRYSYQLAKGEIPEGMYLDHVCRNPSCVRPDHLRPVTPSQNAENQNGHSDSRSGRRGVSFQSRTGKWMAKATANGKTYYGGLFSDPDEAARAALNLRLSIQTHNDADRRAA